jgi:hypothetical protein
MAMFIEGSFYFGTDYPLMYDMFVKNLVNVTTSFCFI